MADLRLTSCFCIPQCILVFGWLHMNICVTLCLAGLRTKAFLSGNVAHVCFCLFGDCPLLWMALESFLLFMARPPKEGKDKVGI